MSTPDQFGEEFTEAATGYIGLELETEPDEIAQEAFDYLATWIDGWEPAEGNLETILIEAQAQEQTVERALASQTTDDIFRYFGWATGVLPREETPARGQTTWTAIDDTGYLIPAGTQLTLSTVDSGEPIGFVVTQDIEIVAGTTATEPGQVPIEAIEPGEAGTGLSVLIEIVDALEWVVGVTVEGVTTGGQDAEESEDYMDRLTRWLQVRQGSLVIPRDYEVVVRNHPLVGRALALDGYNPTTQQWDQERCVTVAAHDDDAGEPLPTGVKNELDAQLQAMREVNFQVFVVDPTYTTIAVTYVGYCLPGSIPETVQAACDAALADFLSPLRWGLPPGTDPGATTGDWLEVRTVRYQDVSAVLQATPGFDYYTTLEVNGGTADVQLTGPAPLTRAGVIDGTLYRPGEGP